MNGEKITFPGLNDRNFLYKIVAMVDPPSNPEQSEKGQKALQAYVKEHFGPNGIPYVNVYYSDPERDVANGNNPEALVIGLVSDYPYIGKVREEKITLPSV